MPAPTYTTLEEFTLALKKVINKKEDTFELIKANKELANKLLNQQQAEQQKADGLKTVAYQGAVTEAQKEAAIQAAADAHARSQLIQALLLADKEIAKGIKAELASSARKSEEVADKRSSSYAGSGAVVTGATASTDGLEYEFESGKLTIKGANEDQEEALEDVVKEAVKAKYANDPTTTVDTQMKRHMKPSPTGRSIDILVTGIEEQLMRAVQENAHTRLQEVGIDARFLLSALQQLVSMRPEDWGRNALTPTPPFA
ncbi:MAG: hypothetical protein K0Q74_1213 [Gammaproteobacteria bacterium]|jgi:hypothetical protein|nr:hypothetical protein [Gammaproteobacteria bacterium]